MKLRTDSDRSIHGIADPDGRLEIIDDIGVDHGERHQLLEAFTVPTGIVSLLEMSRALWTLIQACASPTSQTVFLCPGNGAWLVERALAALDIRPPGAIQPVDISRESSADIRVQGRPDHIIVIEDVVETGKTARKIHDKLNGVDCPVTLASTLWHDRATQTEQVLNAFAGYHQVIVAERVRSDHPLDDVRSLSTIARKAMIPKNQRYSKGRKSRFLVEMDGVLRRHDWVPRLGGDLGYRRDAHTFATMPPP